MRRLSKRLSLIGALIMITYLALLAAPTKPYFIYNSVADKHARLRSLGSPKLVFVGGSSLALGLDSELIERRTGIPVVNMAVNGGFGLRYMLDEVEGSLGPGDIVVLAPEYDHWYGNLLDGGLNMLWALRAEPRTLTSLSSANQYVNLIKHTPEFMQGKFLELLPGRPNPVYNREGFNRYGDFVNHLGLPPHTPLNGMDRIADEPFNPETATTLRQFVSRAGQRGASVLYTFPPLADSQFELADNRASIDQVVAHLSEVPGIMVIGQPVDFVFPDELFFDTIYHLNAEGRARRSEVLAHALTAISVAYRP